MEVSEEQKRRIEDNRAAALVRRNAKLQQCPTPVAPASNGVRLPLQHRSWAPQLNGNHTSVSMDCRREGALPRSVQAPVNKEDNPHNNLHSHHHNNQYSNHALTHIVSHVARGSTVLNASEKPDETEAVKVGVEICAPDRFFLTVKSGRPVQDFFEHVSCVARCENLEPSAKWPVYNLRDYDKVTGVLKGLPGVEYEQIPWSTRFVLEKFQRAAETGVPFGPDHVPDFEVDQLLLKLPTGLAKALLPFQWDGVKFGLQRGGRCLLADEMGVGKTIQAISIASCYREEGSLLVICPASLRLVWAEELERWLSYLSPLDVHLVFGRKNNLSANMPLPKVVVISFNMLARLRESMSSRKWGTVIVDEAHNLRCTKRKVECQETMAALELVQDVKRVVLLTGTPSLSRPFDIFNQVNCLWPKLLGKTKYEFARNYCDRQWSSSGQDYSRDLSKGSRLLELNVLLKQAVMIRRLKDDVMMQLPSKRRQMILLQLSSADIQRAKAFTAATAREKISERLGEEACKCGFTRKGACECEDEYGDESHDECQDDGRSASKTPARMLSEQEIGVAKLRGFEEWLLNNSIFADRDGTSRKKMIVFAHHLKVLDSIQTIVQSKGVEFVRIDGSTLPRDRLNNVNRFRSDPQVKLAIIGVQAGGVGLDFSAARSVAFVELPKSASEMLQAEDRAHRRGQKNSVNIYVFAAKGTSDVKRWQSLSRSLERVSTMTDGAETSLEIDRVIDSSCTQLQASLSQDSCITTQSNLGSLNLSIRAPACENQLRWSNSQFMNTPGGSMETRVDFPASSLMFEVSSNTGRIHLFRRSDDEKVGTTSLQVNFKPEDLAHFVESGVCVRGSLPACLVHNASHREVAALFWEEYCSLRPIFRNRLRGRPLSFPLSAESNSFKDEDQYISGGIVKGGSKRRWTPIQEVGDIPPGASWRTIFFCRKNSLKEKKIVQAWTAENVPLCKYCQKPCKGPRSTKPELFEDFFCQTTCLNEYHFKTNGHYVREELFDLERGVCFKCKLDCHALVIRIKPLPMELRRAYILENAPQLTESKTMLERLIKHPKEGNAWHADHRIAVADGGGECTIENFQTLCFACHAKVTAEQHRRRTSEKVKARKNLKTTVKRLREQSDRKKRRLTTDMEGDSGVDYMDTSEDEDDRHLLNIEVAGSAYSTTGVRTEHACNSILHPPRSEVRDCTQNVSSPAVEGKTELGNRACQSILQARDEDVQDILIGEVSDGSFSTMDITEDISENACKSILQPCSPEGHESTHIGLSSEVEDSVAVITMRASESVLQVRREDDQEILNVEVACRSYSAFGMLGITKDISKNACKSTLQPSSLEGRGSTHTANSPDVGDSSEALTQCACESSSQTHSEGVQDFLNVDGAGSQFSQCGSFSAFGIMDITGNVSEKVCQFALQLSSSEGRESTRIVTPEVEDSTEVLALSTWESILQAPIEDYHDTLNVEVSERSFSASGVTDITEDISVNASKSILQSSSPEDRESTRTVCSFFSKGSTEVLALKSFLQSRVEDEQDVLIVDTAGNSNPDFGLLGITVEHPENACISTRHPSSPGGHESAPTSDVNASTEILTGNACKPTLQASAGGTSEPKRFFKSSPYFPSSGKKSTISLLS